MIDYSFWVNKCDYYQDVVRITGATTPNLNYINRMMNVVHNYSHVLTGCPS